MAGGWLFWRLRLALQRERPGSLAVASWPAAERLRHWSQQIGTLDRDGIGQQVPRLLRDTLGVPGVALYLSCEDAPEFRLAGVAGDIDAPPSVAGADENGQTASRGVRALEQARSSWQACAPLRLNGAALGLIALAGRGDGAAEKDFEATVLAMVAAQVALALHRVQLADHLRAQQATILDLRRQLQAETTVARVEPAVCAEFTEIVGRSAGLRRALDLVATVAPTGAPVLITGETGTGKELMARALHALSGRRAGPLISVNCPAIPPGLAESELFGHERGAFTDAVEARPGKFELADGGTIFLDEIADLAAEMQVKLLRVLQEHETQRIGSRKVRKLDLRVVAATNRDLHAAMRAGRFREDLYYRLAAVVVHVPSLRERGDDIAPLATAFLERASAAYSKRIFGFTAEALTTLHRHRWPGNVRELRHVIERAVLLCAGELIKREHLGELAPPAVTDSQRFGLMIREEKLRRVREALQQTRGNQAAAARLLGISRSNLGRLLKSLGVTAQPNVEAAGGAGPDPGHREMRLPDREVNFEDGDDGQTDRDTFMPRTGRHPTSRV
jgi:transcriptional regulator with GAF, ATPase, and Fis domain